MERTDVLKLMSTLKLYGMAAARGAGLGLPRRNGCFREPDGQAPALAQGDVVGGPIRHPVPLPRDVMTAILAGFEWHGDCPRLGTGPLSYTVHSSPPKRTIRATRSLRNPILALEKIFSICSGTLLLQTHGFKDPAIGDLIRWRSFIHSEHCCPVNKRINSIG
jgi:hypothetical protein